MQRHHLQQNNSDRSKIKGSRHSCLQSSRESQKIIFFSFLRRVCSSTRSQTLRACRRKGSWFYDIEKKRQRCIFSAEREA